MSYKYVRIRLAKPAVCDSEQYQWWVTHGHGQWHRVPEGRIRSSKTAFLPCSGARYYQSVKLSCQSPGVDGNHSIVLLSSLLLCDEVQWFYITWLFQLAEECYLCGLLPPIRPHDAKYSSFPFLTTWPKNRSCLMMTASISWLASAQSSTFSLNILLSLHDTLLPPPPPCRRAVATLILNITYADDISSSS